MVGDCAIVRGHQGNMRRELEVKNIALDRESSVS